jgi:hypothetical protein
MKLLGAKCNRGAAHIGITLPEMTTTFIDKRVGPFVALRIGLLLFMFFLDRSVDTPANY